MITLSSLQHSNPPSKRPECGVHRDDHEQKREARKRRALQNGEPVDQLQKVNYGGDGLVPIDKLFGTWHDGSSESDEQMKKRFVAKKARLNAKGNDTA